MEHSWATSPGSLNTARFSLGAAGTQTAALGFGGSTGSNTGATEQYDGTSWTTSPGSLNTARRLLAGAGTQTAGLGFWWSYYSSSSSNRRMDMEQVLH
jgi:hypothetical protein